MNIENWLQVAGLVVDVIKTLIPFVTIFVIFSLFKREIKHLIKNGGFKVAAPGFSVETLQKQQVELTTKEKKEIELLNSELEKTKTAERILRELQEYTVRDKDTFFLGFHFEKTYRVIFPSQMAILNAMRNNKDEISDALAQAIFRRTIWAQQFNVPYDGFMGFLIQSGLISYQSDKFVLTPLGRTFLEYLTNENIPLKLPANDFVETNSSTN